MYLCCLKSLLHMGKDALLAEGNTKAILWDRSLRDETLWHWVTTSNCLQQVYSCEAQRDSPKGTMCRSS